MIETDVILGGVSWTVEFHTIKTMPKKTWGDCNRAIRRIRVRRDLSPRNFLDTLIHELRHAQHPIMFEAEEFITSTSTEIADALLKLEAVTVSVPGDQSQLAS